MVSSATSVEQFNRLIVGLEQTLLPVFRGQNPISGLRAEPLLDALWALIDTDPLTAIAMARIKSGHAMTPRHGINVMLVARAWMVMRHRLGSRLDDFSFCALIHDLGHWRPDTLVYVFGAFTHAQAIQNRVHADPEPWRDASIDDEMARWIANHHAQPDGKGYPSGVTDPPMLAQVLRIVDCFEGLTTPRRFRPTYTQHEAMILMNRWAGFKFDAKLFRNFYRSLGWYPMGTLVELGSGERAMMLAPDQSVQAGVILTNPQGDPLDESEYQVVSEPDVRREVKHWYWRVPENSDYAAMRPDLLDLPRAYHEPLEDE